MIRKLGLWTALMLVFISIFLFSYPHSINAQQGCCSHHGGISYCDSSVGSYVCNDGSYSPTCGCYHTSPVTPVFPSMTATWNFTPNQFYTYDIKVILNDYNPTRYSVILSKYAGGDPGPLVDYNTPNFIFTNVYPGTWYLNVKKDVNNTWSTVSYWVIDVPEWILPTPEIVPTFAPEITKTETSTSIWSTFTYLIADFWNGLTSVNNTNTVISTPTPTQIPTKKFICNCLKTCTQISTCEEAYFQLDTCGCYVRDGDRDGTPCENLCGK